MKTIYINGNQHKVYQRILTRDELMVLASCLPDVEYVVKVSTPASVALPVNMRMVTDTIELRGEDRVRVVDELRVSVIGLAEKVKGEEHQHEAVRLI